MPLSRRIFTTLASLALALATTSTHAQEQTARLLRDVNREPGEYDAGIDWIMPVPKGTIFPRYTPEHGIELWASNGSPIGTRLLKDIVPGEQGSYPGNPMTIGEGTAAKVAFTIRSAPVDGLWITDGTDKGTVRVFQCDVDAYNRSVIPVAGTTRGVFFKAYLPTTEIPGGRYFQEELLFSDGTEAGTHSLNSIRDDFEPRIDHISDYVTSGQWCYFVANRNQLWRSDGTPAGTEMLLVREDAQFDKVTIAGGRLFMPVGTDADVLELWTCPMAGGEVTRLGDPQGPGWYRIHQIHAAGDRAILLIEGEWRLELWVSDGTAEGTHQLPTGADPDADWHLEEDIRSWNGAVYFQTVKNNIRELWSSDGTPQGTTVLTTIPSDPGQFIFFDEVPPADYFYFWVSDEIDQQQLWRTQGTPASTRPVKGAPPTRAYSSTAPVAQTKSGETFFIAAQQTADEGVWKMRGKNGSAQRMTRPVKATGTGIAPTPLNALPYEMLGGDLLAFVNTGTDNELWRMKPDGRRARSIWKAPPFLSAYRYGSLGFHGTNSRGAIFSVDDNLGVRQVWFTDGTSPGTRLLGDHGTATGRTYPNDFVKVGDRWIYSTVGIDSITKSRLWITDGTPEGTSQVVAADGTAPWPDYASMIAYQDGVAFTATGTDGESELWRSDGTPAGTIRLHDDYEPTAGEKLMNLSVVGGKLRFTMQLTQNQFLGESDGTAAGTSLVDTSFANYRMFKAYDLGGAAIFPGSRTFSNARWWRHDATGISQLQPASIGAHVHIQPYSRELAVAGSQLFYRGTVAFDTELWVTDGTAAGTRQVANLNQDNSSEPAEMLAVGNVIYFSATGAEHGRELWRSDGTAAGTVPVSDINPGPADSAPKDLKVMNGKLYFTAYRHDVGYELFSIDLSK